MNTKYQVILLYTAAGENKTSLFQVAGLDDAFIEIQIILSKAPKEIIITKLDITLIPKP